MMPDAAPENMDAPKEKNAVTLVYQHELSNAPGKSIRGVPVQSNTRA